MGQNQSRGATEDRATGDHFYTLDFKGELAPWSGYEREDSDCYVYSNAFSSTVPVFRYYKSTSTVRDHFYTTDSTGELAPSSGYVYEGIAFYIFNAPQSDTVALNRWYHPQIGDHFYTTHPTGELAPAAGYVREGVLGYVYASQLHGSVPLYRWYHSRKFNFTFQQGITAAQQQIIWERHTWAYYRAGKCTHLPQQQKDEVRAIYERDTIKHGITTEPGVNASAYVGGRSINVNFQVLFPQGDTEIAMSLLHEMMHCAGYRHDFDKSDPRYWDTMPLKAEKCIAGYASDVASPAVHIAHAEMNVDGSLGNARTPLTADEAKVTSGCQQLDAKAANAADNEPAPALDSAADLSGHTDAARTTTSASASGGSTHVDPYDHGKKKQEAIGLDALLTKVHA